MARLVLVHGSCFGAWAWSGVIAELKALGHTALALDLPGRGGEPTTLAEQARAVADRVDGPTVLIGHSAGGFVISAAAGLCPGLRGLIYIAGYIPDGRSLAQMRRAGPAQPMRGAFELTPDRLAYRFAPARCEALFFHDCPNADEATRQLCLEPIAPQETPLGPPPPLRAAALICTDDRAIPPAYQRVMAAGLPCHDFASGHAPFLAKPAALARAMHQILQGWE